MLENAHRDRKIDSSWISSIPPIVHSFRRLPRTCSTTINIHFEANRFQKQGKPHGEGRDLGLELLDAHALPRRPKMHVATLECGPQKTGKSRHSTATMQNEVSLKAFVHADVHMEMVCQSNRFAVEAGSHLLERTLKFCRSFIGGSPCIAKLLIDVYC
jgi:hypothetical protein